MIDEIEKFGLGFFFRLDCLMFWGVYLSFSFVFNF